MPIWSIPKSELIVFLIKTHLLHKHSVKNSQFNKIKQKHLGKLTFLIKMKNSALWPYEMF